MPSAVFSALVLAVAVLRAVSLPVFYRYEELRYWYDCLFYEEELRQYHDYIAAIEALESRQYEVCFCTFQ